MASLPRFAPSLWVALCFGLVPALASGQTPVITSLSPFAVKPGETVVVKVRGGNLAEPTALWTSFTGEAILAPDVADNGKNAAELTYQFKLPAETQVGIHGLRLATAKGISNLAVIIVDDLPSVAQVKPNSSTAQAQALTLPAAVDGNVDSLVRNYYKFSAAAGQRVSFEVLARRIGSPLDPMIRILDAQGRELTYSDDAPGLGADAQLGHTFKDAGEYLVEVRDIRFQGGGNFTYRLRIGDFPCVTVPYPMGAKRGAPATLAFAGAHVDAVQPLTLNLPAEQAGDWVTVGAKAVGGQSSGLVSLSVGTGEEAVEVEPNDDAAAATRVTLGAHINGRFERAGDIDRFVMTAKAGQALSFSGITRQQGSPTDLTLRLLKADGAQVATADDTGTGEGAIEFTFPADGDYTLIVEDLHRRGGTEFAYRIAVQPLQAGFTLAVSTDTLNVPQEGTIAVTVTSVRKLGYNGPIELTLLDAPAGIVATPAVIGPGLNTAVMTILNTAVVPDGKIHAVRIAGKAKIGETEFLAVASATDAQRAVYSNTPLPPAILSNAIALGINPQPFFVLRSEPPTAIFARHLTTTVKLKSIRAADFPEPIVVAVNPPQNGLPPGVTVAVKPVEKDMNEVDIVFTAAANAPLGQFSVNLIGTGTRAGVALTQAAPSITLDIRAPFALKTDFGDAKLIKGGTLKVKVIAERIPAYNGPIVLTWTNLPAGVTPSEATIAEGQTEVEVTLTAAADATVGTVETIVVKGEGTANNQKFAENAPNAKLIVE